MTFKSFGQFFRKTFSPISIIIAEPQKRALAYDISSNRIACGGGKEIISVHEVNNGKLVGLFDPNVEKYHTDKESVQLKKRKREEVSQSDSRVMALCFVDDYLVSVTSDGKLHVLNKEVKRLYSEEISSNHCPTKVVYSYGFRFIKFFNFFSRNVL